MTFTKINVNIDVVHLTCFVVVPFLILLTIVGCVGRPLPSKLDDVDKQPLQKSRPYNIAHRGSNGEFPELTAAAYMVCLLSTCSLIYVIEALTKISHLLILHIDVLYKGL